jgi:hypothetical protein
VETKKAARRRGSRHAPRAHARRGRATNRSSSSRGDKWAPPLTAATSNQVRNLKHRVFLATFFFTPAAISISPAMMLTTLYFQSHSSRLAFEFNQHPGLNELLMMEGLDRWQHRGEHDKVPRRDVSSSQRLTRQRFDGSSIIWNVQCTHPSRHRLYVDEKKAPCARVRIQQQEKVPNHSAWIGWSWALSHFWRCCLWGKYHRNDKMQEVTAREISFVPFNYTDYILNWAYYFYFWQVFFCT